MKENRMFKIASDDVGNPAIVKHIDIDICETIIVNNRGEIYETHERHYYTTYYNACSGW